LKGERLGGLILLGFIILLEVLDATRRLVDFIQRPFKRYRQLHRKKRLVIQAATVITVFQIIANVLYFTYPTWTLTWLEWNGISFSMITSIAAVYYALFGYWRYYDLLDMARDEIYDRLGVPFIKNLADFGKRVDDRFAKLTPEQRTRVLSLIDKIVDRGFDRIGELAEPRPKPKRKNVKRMT